MREAQTYIKNIRKTKKLGGGGVCCLPTRVFTPLGGKDPSCVRKKKTCVNDLIVIILCT